MFNRLVVCLSFLALASCASNPRNFSPWNYRDSVSFDSAFILKTNLVDRGLLKGKHTCNIHMRLPDGKEGMITLRQGPQTHFFKGDPGHYEFMYMTCGMFSKYSLVEMRSFKTRKGSVSLVGFYRFELEDVNNISWMVERPTSEELYAEYVTWPTDLKTTLYSPYSLKKLTSSYFKKAHGEQNIMLTGHGQDTRTMKSGLDMSDCMRAERARNPLFVGPLEIKAVVPRSRMKQVSVFETRISNNTYTKNFKGCVSKKIESLPRPKFSEEVEVSVLF